MRIALVVWTLAVTVLLATTEPRVDGREKKKTQAKSALHPNGHPKGFTKGMPRRYFLWHDQNGWHLRTTTKMSRHHFLGAIEVQGGTITSARSLHLEKSGKTEDHWALDMPGRQRIRFNFRTDQAIDGINFQVSPSAQSITFNMSIDGLALADHVFIGQQAQHPSAIPFTLPAHPKR